MSIGLSSSTVPFIIKPTLWAVAIGRPQPRPSFVTKYQTQAPSMLYLYYSSRWSVLLTHWPWPWSSPKFKNFNIVRKITSNLNQRKKKPPTLDKSALEHLQCWGVQRSSRIIGPSSTHFFGLRSAKQKNMFASPTLSKKESVNVCIYFQVGIWQIGLRNVYKLCCVSASM